MNIYFLRVKQHGTTLSFFPKDHMIKKLRGVLQSNNESRGAGADEKQGIYFAWPNGQANIKEDLH